MPDQIRWALSVRVSGGPEMSMARVVTVEAYDSISVPVEASAADKEIQLQPGGPGQVKFLAITSDRYSTDVSYKVNSAASTDVVLFDEPQIFVGEGAVGLLDPAPTSLFVSNDLAEDIAIQILVGRDATP